MLYKSHTHQTTTRNQVKEEKEQSFKKRTIFGLVGWVEVKLNQTMTTMMSLGLLLFFLVRMIITSFVLSSLSHSPVLKLDISQRKIILFYQLKH